MEHVKNEQDLRALGYERGADGEWRKPRRRPAPAPAVAAGVQNAEQRERAAALAGGGRLEAPRAGCPLVRFTLRRQKLLDVDAKWASVKDLLDGLRYAELIRGDKEGEVRLEVRQEKVRRADEETVIEIDYP